jgi:hypothetical protein
MEVFLVLRFFQKHYYGNDVKTVVDSLKFKPNTSWEKDQKYNEFEQGFSYEKKYPMVPHIDEGIIGDFLNSEEFAQENLDAISKMMGYDLELFIAIYSNGQVNPGIHIGNEVFKLFNNKFGFLPEIDIDIYCIDGDEKPKDDE